MIGMIEILPNGLLRTKKNIALPEVLDILILGAGPAGTSAAFRAMELDLSALVIDYDDIMKRIRDYSKDKLILPDFGGGDKIDFPNGGPLISLLKFEPIDKDELCNLWKRYYFENDIPAKIGIELVDLRRQDNMWRAKTWNHHTRVEEFFLAKAVVVALGRGVPRRFDIPGNTEGIAFRLVNPSDYIGAPVCVIGGGTSAAEAVIAISNEKGRAKETANIYWSYRGDKMPRVSKALAEAFFDAYVGNGNICYLPKSEPTAVVAIGDRGEFLSIRKERKEVAGQPIETVHFEFPKEQCIACIGEDVPEALLNKVGIEMYAAGESNKKRIAVTPMLESQQQNIFIAGDLLSQAYLETEDFKANPSTYREVKHRGNIKSALWDGVFVVEAIAQRLGGKSRNSFRIDISSRIDKRKNSNTYTRNDNIDADSFANQKEKANSQVWHDARLVRILPGDLEEQEYELAKNGITTIGKAECDIAFSGDKALLPQDRISIIHRPEGYFLRDDGCTGGVFIRAPRTRTLEALPGDILRIGKQFLTFRSGNGKIALMHYRNTGTQLQSHILSEKPLLLGREAPDVILDTSDMSLSRRHVSIAVRENKILVKDLNSANGSYLKVNGIAKLAPGDQFRFGEQLLMLCSTESVVSNGTSAKPKIPSQRLGDKITNPRSRFDFPDKKKSRIEIPGYLAAKNLSPEALKAHEKGMKLTETELVVTFKNNGKVCNFQKGQTICKIAKDNSIKINAECFAGRCGSDPIRIISGKENLNPPEEDESETLEEICELEPGLYRLACMAKPQGAVIVEILDR